MRQNKLHASRAEKRKLHTEGPENGLRSRGVFRHRELPWYLELLLAVALAGAITFLEVWIQPNPLKDTLYDFVHYPVLLVLNVVPAFLMIIAFGALTGNVCIGAAVTEILLCGLSVGNRMKVEYRNEPVWPSDLLLIREVRDAAENYSLQYPWKVIAAVVLSAILLILLAVLLRHKKSREAKNPAHTRRNRLLRRGALFLSACGLLTAMIFTVYASDALYAPDNDTYPRCNSYRLAGVYCELGTTYSFLHNITTQMITRPENYSSAEAEAWDTAAPEDASGAEVHVILVMCEAFSDITDQGVFSFSSEDDPLQNFHALQQEANAISGHLVVSRFGGGTANTEYDVLTGMQASALSASTETAFYAVKQNLDSLYRIFNADGYETSFLHPGYDWFYNRKNVYQYLGAQLTVFNDDMQDPEMKGTWITDDYLGNLLEQEFEQTVSDGKLMFSYVTTVENHSAYSYDKFGENYSYPGVETTEALPDDLQEIAEVYTEGIRDTDAMIGKLVRYYKQSEQPVVLAFFGDHLPSLGGNFDNYAKLGISLSTEATGTDAYLRSMETPWVIWANDRAASELDWDAQTAALGLPANHTISASYLGAMVLELTGRGDATPWFSWLNQMRRELPVVAGDTIENAEGQITNVLTERQEQLIEKWHCWSYYKLKDKAVG